MNRQSVDQNRSWPRCLANSYVNSPGVLLTPASQATPADATRIRDRYYRPFQNAIRDAIASTGGATWGVAAQRRARWWLFDIHSVPSGVTLTGRTGIATGTQGNRAAANRTAPSRWVYGDGAFPCGPQQFRRGAACVSSLVASLQAQALPMMYTTPAQEGSRAPGPNGGRLNGGFIVQNYGRANPPTAANPGAVGGVNAVQLEIDRAARYPVGGAFSNTTASDIGRRLGRGIANFLYDAGFLTEPATDDELEVDLVAALLM